MAGEHQGRSKYPTEKLHSYHDYHALNSRDSMDKPADIYANNLFTDVSKFAGQHVPYSNIFLEKFGSTP